MGEVRGNWGKASKNPRWSHRLKLGLQQRAVTAHDMLSTRKLVKSQCQGVLWNNSEVVPALCIAIFWAPGKKAGFSTNQCLQRVNVSTVSYCDQCWP